MYYGLRIGMGYEAAMRQPVGRMRELMALEQIKREGARYVDDREYDPETMTVRDIFPEYK